MTLTLLISICGYLPHFNDYRHNSQPCAQAFQAMVCSRSDVAVIRDDDPALILFEHRGYRDAKIDLADERANGCELG